MLGCRLPFLASCPVTICTDGADLVQIDPQNMENPDSLDGEPPIFVLNMDVSTPFGWSGQPPERLLIS